MEIAITKARATLSHLLKLVIYQGRRIKLTRHGKVVAALVNVGDLGILEDIDEEDRQAFEEADREEARARQTGPPAP